MKYFAFILFFMFFLQLVYAQESVGDRQLSLGVTGIGSTESVTHIISAVGKVWEFNGTSFTISNDPEIYNSNTVSVGNADFINQEWDAFFNWKWDASGEDPVWGLGFYKITPILPEQGATNNDNYFYLDGRDSDWSSGVYNPDLYTVFKKTAGIYQIFDWPYIPANIIPVENGEIIREWDVHNQQPNTSGLNNYWSNVLLLIEGGDPYARIAWGPHPTFNATNYKIYRALSTFPVNPRFLTFDLITITNSTTYEYIDREFVIGGTTTYYAWYYVKAYNSSSNNYSPASNTVNTSGEYMPFKIAFENPEETQAFGFSLNQNYPNPFNPSTTIKFSVTANSLVSLIVYDILGNEKAVLVDELKEPGTYSVNFDASNFSSGIYFYTLRANEYTSSRKMLLLK